MGKRLNKRGIVRALKYAGISVIIMVFELALLFALVEFGGWNEVVASACALIVALVVNYFFSRRFVFTGTKQKVGRGLAIFLGFACFGVLAVTVLMYIAVEILQYQYLVSRIIIGLLVSGVNYLNNLFFNFKVNEKN